MPHYPATAFPFASYIIHPISSMIASNKDMSGEGIARFDRFGRTSYPFYFSDGVDINGITGESLFDYIQRVEKADNGIMEAMIGHWERRLKR